MCEPGRASSGKLRYGSNLFAYACFSLFSAFIELKHTGNCRLAGGISAIASLRGQGLCFTSLARTNYPGSLGTRGEITARWTIVANPETPGKSGLKTGLLFAACIGLRLQGCATQLKGCIEDVSLRLIFVGNRIFATRT